jgi:hypothetical protein
MPAEWPAGSASLGVAPLTASASDTVRSDMFSRPAPPCLPSCSSCTAPVQLHIAGLREDGLPVPEPSSEGEIVEVGAA